MSYTDKKFYIVAYDISDPKRLVKVHKYIKKQGIPLQYSLFVVPMTHLTRRVFVEEMGQLIDTKQDDVRIYPLPKMTRVTVLGKQMNPEGVYIDQQYNNLLDKGDNINAA